MTTLVAGATGATGKLLVEHLLSKGHQVRVIVRPGSAIPDSWKTRESLTVLEANISEISREEMYTYLKGCDGAASCLGHNLTFSGIFGKPRKLVTDAVKLMCEAVSENKPDKPFRFVLMNTSGNRNRDLDEPVSSGQKIIIAMIRLLLPPHSDNENAADYLRQGIGQNNSSVQWVAVRPDSLITDDEVTEYEIYQSPVRSAIFNPGKTSRINVGHFMARLLSEDELWGRWKGQMPMIYNKDDKQIK